MARHSTNKLRNKSVEELQEIKYELEQNKRRTAPVPSQSIISNRQLRSMSVEDLQNLKKDLISKPQGNCSEEREMFQSLSGLSLEQILDRLNGYLSNNEPCINIKLGRTSPRKFHDGGLVQVHTGYYIHNGNNMKSCEDGSNYSGVIYGDWTLGCTIAFPDQCGGNNTCIGNNLGDQLSGDLCPDAGYPNGDWQTAECISSEDHTEHCPEGSCGDINGDGILNVLDIVAEVNIALGNSDYDPCGDINGDGTIDVLDIVALVGVVLGGDMGGWTCPLEDVSVSGCTDATACNYNAEATEDDGSCEHDVDNCGVCGGDNTCDYDGRDGEGVCCDAVYGCCDEFCDQCSDICPEGWIDPEDCEDCPTIVYNDIPIAGGSDLGASPAVQVFNVVSYPINDERFWPLDSIDDFLTIISSAFSLSEFDLITVYSNGAPSTAIWSPPEDLVPGYEGEWFFPSNQNFLDMQGGIVLLSVNGGTLNWDNAIPCGVSLDDCGVCPEPANEYVPGSCYDECGAPDGPGDIYCDGECGVTNATFLVEYCDALIDAGVIGSCNDGGGDYCYGTSSALCNYCDCDGTETIECEDGSKVCNLDDCDVHGCTDSAACNYNADAVEDDGSCLGNDCAGDCGGTAEVLSCPDDSFDWGFCEAFNACPDDGNTNSYCTGDGTISDCPTYDALGVCGGTCQSNADCDQYCDDDGGDVCVDPATPFECWDGSCVSSEGDCPADSVVIEGPFFGLNAPIQINCDESVSSGDELCCQSSSCQDSLSYNGHGLIKESDADSTLLNKLCENQGYGSSIDHTVSESYPASYWYNLQAEFGITGCGSSNYCPMYSQNGCGVRWLKWDSNSYWSNGSSNSTGQPCGSWNYNVTLLMSVTCEDI